VFEEPRNDASGTRKKAPVFATSVGRNITPSLAPKETARLAKHARSESVLLAALGSILTDMMAVCEFPGLEERIARLEEQDLKRDEEGASEDG
jgi:hypothetical protein